MHRRHREGVDGTRIDSVEEVRAATDGRNEDSRVSVVMLRLLQGENVRLRLHLSLHRGHLVLGLLLLFTELLLGKLLFDGGLEGRLGLDRLLRRRLGGLLDLGVIAAAIGAGRRASAVLVGATMLFHVVLSREGLAWGLSQYDIANIKN